MSNTCKSHLITINGVNISFPYKPYDVQVQFMSKLLDCLKGQQNGLLESPTGTGKTLSLLCATLSWLENHKAYQQALLLGLGGGPQRDKGGDLFTRLSGSVGTRFDNPAYASTKVIYSSRTHAQLSQVVQELKKTSYNNVTSVVLGSRDQLCLLPEVANIQTNSAKLHACRAKVKNRSCPYYLNVENKLAQEPDYRKNSVMDIEDLVTLGKKHTCCPYYAAKVLKNTAELIFTPYNYLIDPKTRHAHDISLQNCVVIFDEAHNIESICEDSMSFQLRSRDLAFALNEITQIIQSLSSSDHHGGFSQGSPDTFNFTIEDAASIKVMLSILETELDKIAAEKPETGTVKEGNYMFELLAKAELTPEKKDRVQNILEEIMQYLNDQQSMGAIRGVGLGKICDMLTILYSASEPTSRKQNATSLAAVKFNEHYKVFIQEEKSINQSNPHDFWTVGPKRTSDKKCWSLSCWCFSASRSMRDLMEQQIHCMILTSGTLAPLGSFASELGIAFPVQLENPHIIDDNQVLVAVVERGPDRTELISTFANRGNMKYLNSLGQTINNFCQVIPKGILTIFPSYAAMNQCLESWQTGPVWRSLGVKKEIFTEPKGKDSFVDCMEKFSNSISDPSSHGALLFAVCRGKVSEGLDFSDDNARGVIITGIPYAPLFDKRVLLKKEYLDANRAQGLSGGEWYNQQALRAVNQAVGRVIRHRNDYGVVLLCDNRYSKKDYQSQLSVWVRHRVQSFKDFASAQKAVSQFFKKRKELSPTSVKPQAYIPTTTTSITSSNYPVKYVPNQSPSSSSLTSIKPCETEEDIFKTYSSGEQTPPFSKTKRKESVFDALDMDSEATNTSNAPSASGTLPSFTTSEDVFHQPTSIAPKKRKINLKPLRLDGYKEQKTETPLVQTAVQKAKLLEEKKQDMRVLMKRIKTVHGSDGVKRLDKAIKIATANHNVNVFVKELVDLCQSFPDKENVFKGIIVLLPFNMRAEFLASTKDMFVKAQ